MLWKQTIIQALFKFLVCKSKEDSILNVSFIKLKIKVKIA